MVLRRAYKIKSPEKKLLAALLAIILFFLCIETVLAIAGFRPQSTSAIVDPQMRFYGAKQGRGRLKENRRCIRDPLLFWRLIPRPGEVNSTGFRSKKDYSINKEKGVYRIICLGDSITYGVWVKIERTYPYVLEQMLNANSGYPRFEVINAGVMGYSSLQGLRQLKRDLLRYKPDLITVLFGFDDNHAAIAYSDEEQRTYNRYVFALQNMLRNSRFYCLLEIFAYRIRDAMKNNSSSAVSGKAKRRVEPEDYRRNLQEIIKAAQENNSRILFLTPVVFRLQENEINYLKDYSDTIPQGYAIDLLEELRKHQREAELFLDGCHFTPQGHWIVAKEIYEDLLKKKIVNPKQEMADLPMPAYPKDSLPEEIKESSLKTYIKMGENEIGALSFGWHDLEKIGDRYARFTYGFQANAYLKNSRLQEEEKRLKIEMFSYIPAKVTIFINNYYLADVECLPHLWKEVEFPFKDNAEFLKISVCSGKTFKPSVEFGAQDDRTLGVAISKIEIAGKT